MKRFQAKLLLFLAFPLTAAAQWIPTTSMPEPRYGAASAVYGERLYVFGGVDGDQNVRTETFAYNSAGQTWETNHTPLPVPRRQAAAVVFGGKIYVIGGSNGSAPSDSVFAYDPDTETWELAGRLVTPREGCAAVVWRDNIYVLGGVTGTNVDNLRYLSDIEIFDTVARRGVAVSISLPEPPRANLAAAVFMGKLYVMGGMYFGPVALVDALDDNGQWTRLPDLRVPRAFTAAVVGLDGLYVLGGEGFDGPLRSVEWLSSYTPDGPFFRVDSFLVARAEMAAGSVQGTLIAAGGRGANGTLMSVETMFTQATGVRSSFNGKRPTDFRLAGPYPNPFSRTTRISLTLPEGAQGRAEFTVFDCRGRAVRHLTAGRTGRTLWATWDGRDDFGDAVPSGVYLTRIEVASTVLTRKVVYVR